MVLASLSAMAIEVVMVHTMASVTLAVTVMLIVQPVNVSETSLPMPMMARVLAGVECCPRRCWARPAICAHLPRSLFPMPVLERVCSFVLFVFVIALTNLRLPRSSMKTGAMALVTKPSPL